MKNTKRIIAVVMLIITVFTSLTVSSSAASSPTWTINAVTNITETDAKISSSLKFSSKVKVTEGGFYIGTSSNNLKKNAYPDKCNITVSTLNSSFLMSKYHEKLKSDTTYYYKIYAVAAGKTYYSPVKSFKTNSSQLTVSWKVNNPTDITCNDARISTTATLSKKATLTEGGFYIGTSSSNLKKNAYPDKCNISNTKFDSSFLMSKYHETLKANTTYYYKVYIVVNGKTYYSSVCSLKTPPVPPAKAEPTKICFPLTTSQTWFASTYNGHGGVYKSAICSVDITLKNGKSCRGYAVYAVEAGTVYDVIANNGQVTIKHTKKLVTTNGVTYSSWYSTYAHMSNISVKKGATVKSGQQIGKVSDVGNAKGAHLHFSIASAENGKSLYQKDSTKYAISPYYVYGFVSKDAKNTSYLIRDVQGPAVTTNLINHKPAK